MTEQELTAFVEKTAGAVVASALERVIEKRRDLAPRETLRPDPKAFDKSLTLGYMSIALAAAKGRMSDAADYALKNFSGEVGEEIHKALTAGSLSDGGAFINPEHSQSVIDVLTPQTVVRKRIKMSVDVSSGMMDMPRVTADAAVSWGGEIAEIRESQPGTDQLVMRPFEEKVMVPFSNTFLRRGGPRVAEVVRNSTLRAMRIGEDVVFLTSPGTEHRPKGLQYWANATTNRVAAQAFTGTDAAKLLAVTQDLGKLIQLLEQANVPMTGAAWALSPRSKNYLMTARDGNGNFAFRPEMLTGQLWTLPFDVTTSVPNTLGTGADESLVFLTDYDEFMLGQGSSLQVDMSDQGTIIDVDGNVISLYQRNMSALRVINQVDLKPQHAEATCHLTGVKWST